LCELGFILVVLVMVVCVECVIDVVFCVVVWFKVVDDIGFEVVVE